MARGIPAWFLGMWLPAARNATAGSSSGSSVSGHETATGKFKNRTSSNPPAERWLLARAVRATLQRFAETWAQLPRDAWRVWLSTLGLGWLLSACLMLGLVWVGRATIGDESDLLLRLVRASPLSFHAAIWVETPGNSIFLVPVMLVAATIAVWWNAPLHALSIMASFCMIDTLVLIGWLGWNRARPELIYEGIAAPGFNSFPSGHVAQTITVYGLLTYFWIVRTSQRGERYLALLLCVTLVVAVGLARLCLGAHWPSDLLAGAAIGSAWLATLIVALRRAERYQGRARVSAADTSRLSIGLRNASAGRGGRARRRPGP